MSDTSVNSTPTLQVVTTFNGVQTTMDTCTVTLLNPNLVAALGPVVPTQVTAGLYQFTLPLGTLTLPGVWSEVWYAQKNAQSNQVTKTFSVGN